MYHFRTKPCWKKRNCQNQATCFDYHSHMMKRRMPQLIKAIDEWNYIPKLCPHWRDSKKCIMGENCPLAHGWLEMIYHPLLYKTKLCNSKRNNGVCIAYGVYCTKAHGRREIRSLVNIFGEHWKRYYNFSKRLGFQNDDKLPELADVRISRCKRQRMCVGVAATPKSYKMLDVNLFAYYLLEKQALTRDLSRERLKGKVESGLWSDLDDHFKELDTNTVELDASYGMSLLVSEEQAVSDSPVDKLRNEYLGLMIKGEQNLGSLSTNCETKVVSDCSNLVQ